MHYRTSMELHVPAALAVAELEATPAFQRYSEQLHLFVTLGKPRAGLVEVTPPFVAMLRNIECGPTTILIALHRAGFNVGAAASVANQDSNRRYTAALDQLWYQYFQAPNDSSALGDGHVPAEPEPEPVA